MTQLLDERSMSRLRWRCRRGLLENDLFVQRFLQACAPSLTTAQAEGLMALMDLSDPELLDLLLGRRELEGELNRPSVRQVLTQMRQPLAQRASSEPAAVLAH